MNNRRDRHAPLLAETFHGDWNEGVPARLALLAAACARRRHRTRRAVVACAGSMVVLLLIAVATFRPGPKPTPRVVDGTTPARGYEIISDAELLAMLQDRAVAVVKRADGSNEFLLIGDEVVTPVVFE